MKSKVIVGALLVVGALLYFGDAGDTPLSDAARAGDFDLTLAGYKAGSVEDRAGLIAAYVADQGLPEDDAANYVACMGDYAGTKAETLEFKAVFDWCAVDAQHDRAAFERHFNELDAKDLSAEAAALCRTYVETQLKSPATADFPFALNTSGKGRWQYLVNSHVDAQNEYGATVRTYFTCDMQYTGGDGEGALDYQNWTMLDFRAGQ